jgi:hypothetical protein
MRRTAIALLLLVSGSAAAVAQPAKYPLVQAPQKGHCAVGVMSDLGAKLRTSKANFIGKNIHEDVPIESWHIDDLVVDRIRDALGKRAAVQRIPYRKELIVLFETAPWFGENLFLRQSFANRVRTPVTGTRCARYVVATLGHDIDIGHGLAIVVLLGGHAFVHAVITLRVYDGETFARLRVATNLYGARRVDESLWPDPPGSAAQNTRLREAIRELVARELDTMLPKLPLTP